MNVATLKAELSKYLGIAQKGEEVMITSHGQEIAKVVSAQTTTTAAVNWKKFFQKHPPLKTKGVGIAGSEIIRQIRDEE